jgi:alkylation response protein AidB-like acyl-CoA dehydrogenase
VPIRPFPKARVIATEAEALAVAHDLAARIAPGASERDRTRAIPHEVLDWISQEGLFGITVPRSHGGADVSFATLTDVFRILSAADAAIGQLPQNHFVFVEALRQDGTPAQQAFFFAEILAGARLAMPRPSGAARRHSIWPRGSCPTGRIALS